MIVRDDYRKKRLAFLKTLIDIQHSKGLEIGAFDFPLVLDDQGYCEFADYQSKENLALKFKVPDTTIVSINYLLERERPVHEQIDKLFDYIAACHVLEHIPDPIGYLQNLEKLLNPGGIIFLAIPDKRRTPDKDRQSTSLYILLDRYFQQAKLPSLADVMDFAKTWLEEKHVQAKESLQTFYQWAIEHYKSGEVDIHCIVWQDKEFFDQFAYLAKSNFLSQLTIVNFQENIQGYNEFYVAFGLKKKVSYR